MSKKLQKFKTQNGHNNANKKAKNLTKKPRKMAECVFACEIFI